MHFKNSTQEPTALYTSRPPQKNEHVLETLPPLGGVHRYVTPTYFSTEQTQKYPFGDERGDHQRNSVNSTATDDTTR